MSNFEKPPEPQPEARTRPHLWWAFALHLAVCYFIPALVARNDFLFNLDRKGGDIYFHILPLIGGIILASFGKSWILRFALFITGLMTSYPILIVSALINYCAFRRLCL